MTDPTLSEGIRPYPTRAIIYPDGKVIHRAGPISLKDITSIICDQVPQAPRGLDTINLRDGHVMFVHDMGHICLPSLDENPGATAAYRAMCLPNTTHYIAGIAIIVPDEDFA